ncbi:TetR/AcrR family transcriptional regulator [Renibacterium salmoninarum]|nr:TetR/AcrR family transcriptional regulator [Renibacterium salmoninarum]
MPGANRAPRKDSAANRLKLVAAAQKLFAERGLNVTLDEVARKAGVGTGTAYRHFANKSELAAVVLAGATQAIADDAQAALAAADPWQGLVQFFSATAARQAADRGLYESLSRQGDDKLQSEIWPGVFRAVAELFEVVQASEQIRADAVPEDVAAILVMLGPAVDMSREAGTELWRRYLSLLLAGLRNPDSPVQMLSGPIPLPEQRMALIQAGMIRR